VTADTTCGFHSGARPLDDYFARHAFANDQTGIGCAYVLRRSDGDDPNLPAVLGFFTLSMATVLSEAVASLLPRKPPRYPIPVALIGRLAVDQRARGRRFGERLLVDALRRAVEASRLLGCAGVIVDAKDEDAKRFYAHYDFVTIMAEEWPHRMFLPIAVIRDAFEPD
jgi:predicted GNAT family N-acyltransferase